VVEDEVESGLEEAEFARKTGKKRKRSGKKMSIPEVLGFLRGDETLELMDYLFRNYLLTYMNEIETLKYTHAFNILLQQYLSPPQTQQTEQQLQPPRLELPRPQNPLDALVMGFVERIADRVIDYILSNPAFQNELKELIKTTVASMAQAAAPELITQQ